MLEEYLNIDLKRLTWFSASVILVAVLTTLLYWLIFGFDVWKKNVQIASDLMLAANAAPFQQQIQPNYIQQQSVQPQYMQQTQSQPPLNNAVSSGQYVCPVHGAIGLPQCNAAGVPMCPMGDQIMQFRTPTGVANNTGAANNLTLAAGG